MPEGGTDATIHSNAWDTIFVGADLISMPTLI
jgi:hypothetical protein